MGRIRPGSTAAGAGPLPQGAALLRGAPGGSWPAAQPRSVPHLAPRR